MTKGHALLAHGLFIWNQLAAASYQQQEIGTI
jgi:hypothetical protein